MMHSKQPIKGDWLDKGIYSIADFLELTKVTLSTEFQGVTTNFLEYNNICFRILENLDRKDAPLRRETLPRKQYT